MRIWRYSFSSAAHRLRRNPAYLALTTVAVALGIGAATTIFGLADPYLFRTLPIPDGERILVLHCRQPALERASVSLPEFLDWRAKSRSFEAMVARSRASVAFFDGREAFRVDAVLASEGALDFLGLHIALGKGFSTGDHQTGAARVAVVSAGFFRDRLGGDPARLGAPIRLDGQAVTLIGVLSRARRWERLTADVWLPLEAYPPQTARGSHYLNVLGRLRPNISLSAARDELHGLARSLDEQYRNNQGIFAYPLREQVLAGRENAFRLLLGAALALALLAATNAASLVMARLVGRRQDLAVEQALGASRLLLTCGVLAECLLISILGAAVGSLLAVGGAAALRRAIPASVFSLPPVVDGRALAFACIAALLTTLVAGLAVTWQVFRRQPAASSSLAHRGAVGREAAHLRRGLALIQIALATLLCVGSALLLRGLTRLQAVEPGFRKDGVVIARLSLPKTSFAGPTEIRSFYSRLLASLRGLAGNISASMVSNVPLEGRNMNGDVEIEGRTFGRPEDVPLAEKLIVSPGYFEVMGIRHLRGRSFTEADGDGAPHVVLVSAAFAERLWPNENPIGRRIRAFHDQGWEEIVGVVSDVRENRLESEGRIAVYTPHAQFPSRSMAIVLRGGSQPPSGLVPALRRAVRALDPELPLGEVTTIESLVSDSVSLHSLSATLLGGFGVLALVMACLGVYGVLAFSVAQRTREMGLRLALGASASGLLRLVLSDGLRVIGFGLATGIVGALFLGRLGATLLYEVSPHDPAAFAGATAVILLAGCCASLAPALRAASVEPAVALRQD